MKPLFLKIQAFGPFVEKVELDFAAFEKHQLFLIHGQTGAGKTTIFDAICYALYGEATLREGDKMRSAFAEDSSRTIVEFNFQIRGRFFYVKRELYIPKTRKKDDDEIAEVKLINTQTFYETDRDGNGFGTVLTKINEIDKKVKEIIGFNANQFKQIVILPQGKFDELLKATTDEKMPILKEIFNAYLFEKMAGLLEKAKKEYQDRTKLIKSSIELQLTAVEIPDEENLQIKIIEVIEKVEAFKKDLPKLEINYKTATKNMELADQLINDFKKYEGVSMNLSEHLKGENFILTEKNNLQKYEKAEKLRAPILSYKNLIKDISLIDSKIKEREKESNQLNIRLDEVLDEEKSIPSLNETIKVNNESIYKYENLKPKYNEIIGLNTELAKLVEKGGQKRNLGNSFENELKALSEQNLSLQQERKNLEPIEKSKSGLEILVSNLKEIQVKHKVYLQNKKLQEALGTETENNFNQVNSATEKNLSIEKSYSALELKWRKSQSALLAITLQNDMPCPVCGSLSHPNPAEISNETVSDNELNALKSEKETIYESYKSSLEKYQNSKNSLSALNAKLETLENELKEYAQKTGEQLNNELRKINDEWVSSQKAEIRIKEIDEQAKHIEKAVTEKEDALSIINGEIKDLLNDHGNKTKDIKKLVETIPENLKTLDALLIEIKKHTIENEKTESKIKLILKNKESLSNQISLLQGSLKASYENSLNLKEKEGNEKNSLNGLLKQMGFETLADAENNFKPEQEVLTIKNKISAWESNKLKLETEKRAFFDLVKDKAKPEITLLKESLDETDTLYKNCLTGLTSQNNFLETLQKVKNKIIELNENFSGLQEQENHITILSDVANGKNTYKQKFETYVLSVFLDEVLQYANKRLHLLSKGRYQLLIKSKAGSRRDVTLDLEVFDTYNNKCRDVQSLSGGETFYTSLCLALGLADVATAKAGGKKLDAIFIDEGFGTLDSQTLDDAINALMSIEGEHRMIGIISHVAELKERIPARLEVIKGKNGSTLKISA